MTRSQRTSGLTLIEMLVGLAITLVMMAAVVNLFANITAGVRNRQATMEVSAELRIARARLYKDLAGATALKYPKDSFAAYTKPDNNNPPDGYFEIVEGNYSDENPGAAIDPSLSMVPSSNNPLYFDADGKPLDPTKLTDGMGRGDYDDILAMTVRSESKPFRGRGRGLCPGGNPAITGPDSSNPIVANRTNPTGDWIDMTVESDLAEVIWYAVEDPNTGLRNIYRRTLLIVPWYGSASRDVDGDGNPEKGSDPLLDLTDPSGNRFPSPNSFSLRMQYMRRFQANYDISVRFENRHLIPNSLSDLARREHRFAHMTNPTGYPGDAANPIPGYFPYVFPYNVVGFNDSNPPYPGTPNSALQPLGDLQELTSYPPPEGERTGEDLMLSNALAFDVRVFDPGAPLFYFKQQSIVQPSTFSDPASSSGSGPFVDAVLANKSNPNDPDAQLTGFGAYVDLGWNDGGHYDYTAVSNAPVPLFQQEHRAGWHPTLVLQPNDDLRTPPSVYDTWTTYYETDGVDQESRPFYSSIQPPVFPPDHPPYTWQAWQVDNSSTAEIENIDQGTNGLDDNGINGPDDSLERETSPPYPYPLQGVQVKLRLYEPESRQIRETTVTRKLDE